MRPRESSTERIIFNMDLTWAGDKTFLFNVLAFSANLGRSALCLR
jgi:hypothetical protein